MSRRACRHVARWAGTTTLAWLLGGALPVHAATLEAEAPTDLLGQAWYYTEVVVFERPRVMEYSADEALARAPAPLPGNLRWLAPPGPAGGPRYRDYDLYPITRATLAFPYLDRSLLPELVVASDGFADPRFSDRRLSDPRFGDGARAAQQDGAALDPRRRPVPTIEPRLAPDPVLDFLRELAAFEASLADASYRWLGPETFTLNPEAARLERRGGYRVLLHGRWLQPVPPRDAPEPLLFRVGPRFGDAYSLEGAFAVTLGRYLHFRARLYYTEPLLGRRPVDRPQPGAAGTLPVPVLAFDPAGVMQLNESRRLRSDELHYLDHPKLGVLVRITPAQPPEALSAAFAALGGEAGEEPVE